MHELQKLSSLEVGEEHLEFKKPVIMAINACESDDPVVGGGLSEAKETHWLCIVILPKKFRGLLHSVVNQDDVKEDDQVEKVYLFDSLCSNRKLPDKLEYALKFGFSRLRDVEGTSVPQILPPLLSPNAVFKFNSGKLLQTSTDNTCGLWSVYNGVMTLFEGYDDFWVKFPLTSSVNDRAEAGLYLRRLTSNLLSQQCYYDTNLLEKSHDTISGKQMERGSARKRGALERENGIRYRIIYVTLLKLKLSDLLLNE